MATLYWGGGNGTWDGFTTANWYTDVGRTTLSTRAPSAEDDVVFDSASNATAYTVTIANNTTVCRNVTIAGPASGNLTLAGTGIWYIYGNLTLPATGFTRTFTGQLQFFGTGSHTITTNGVTLASAITFAGTGTYVLQDALNIGTSVLQVNSGTFNADGKNLTCGSITTTAVTTAGTLTLGASTVSATTINANAPLIINGGTSSITLSNASAGIGTGVNYTGNTFYNVTFSSTAITTTNFYGNNTFNNLTFAAKSSATVSSLVFYGNQTVNGTLTIAGQFSVRRYFIQSNITGTTRTLTASSVASLVDVDFRDITAAGASAPWSGTQLGDCGGNTSITFPSAKTVYWNSLSGGPWTGNFWAAGSGGAVNVANFPLAQDTAIIDDAGLNAGAVITGLNGYNLKTFTSVKTNGYSVNGTAAILYGDLTLTTSAGFTAVTVVFAGRVTQNLTSSGNFIDTITCNGFGASVKLLDNTTVTNWNINSGGLDTNNQNFTLQNAITSSINLGPFSLTLGSSSVSISGSNGFSSATGSTPMTVNAGTSTITLTNLSQALFGFAGQSLSWYNVISLSVGLSESIYGNNTFNNLTFSAPTATNVSNLNIFGDQTITGTLAFGGGTSVTQRLGVVSSTPGTQRTITAAAVTGLSDVDFRDIAAAGASAPWSGTRLGNCQGNSGITFPAGTNKYWNLAGTQNWSATAWSTLSGGSPSANDFPLAQDTCIFNDAGSAGTVTFNAPWNIGTIDASARTSAMTFAGAATVIIYGNVTYGSGITSTFSGSYFFRGTSTQVFTTAGKSIASRTEIQNPLCNFQHGDAYTSTNQIVVYTGSYSTQNYNVTCLLFTSNTSDTRIVSFGTSTVTLTTGAIFVFNFGASGTTLGLTSNLGASTILVSGSGNKNFHGAGQSFGTVSSTGGTTANTFTITGNNTFGTLTNTTYRHLVFTAGTTQTVTNFTYTGVSGSEVRFYSSVPGQKVTLKTDSNAVGANSVNGGNNSGLSFTGASPNYFYVKDITYTPKVIFGTGNFFMFF